MTMQTLRDRPPALLLVSLVVLRALTFAAHALTALPTTPVGILGVRPPIRGCLTTQEVASTVGLRISRDMDRQGHSGVDVDPAYGTTVSDGRLGDTRISTEVRPLAVVDNTFLDNAGAPYVSGILVARVNLPC